MKYPQCYVCERQIHTDPVPAGWTKDGVLIERHARCEPGSRAWAEKFPGSQMGRWYWLKQSRPEEQAKRERLKALRRNAEAA